MNLLSQSKYSVRSGAILYTFLGSLFERQCRLRELKNTSQMDGFTDLYKWSKWASPLPCHGLLQLSLDFISKCIFSKPIWISLISTTIKVILMQRRTFVKCKIREIRNSLHYSSELSIAHIGLFFQTLSLNQYVHFPVVFILIHKILRKYDLYRYWSL